MTNEDIAIKQHLSKPRPLGEPCGCLGPQGDDPACPCAMAWYEKVGGDWYQIKELRGISGIALSATKIK